MVASTSVMVLLWMAIRWRAWGGEQVQSDYAQNDSTAKDYIKNRPGGYEGGYKITWDGDTTGKTVVDIDEGFSMVKVSDAILSQEDVIGGTINAGSAEVFTISSEMIVPIDESNFALGKYIVIVADAPAIFLEIELPEAGIYFVSAPSYGVNVNSLSKLIVFQYDDKYIPDTILRENKAYTNDERNVSITWDGNTDGKDTFNYNGFPYYKLSDEVLPFKGVQSVSSRATNGNTDDILYEGTNCYKAGIAIVVTQAGTCTLANSQNSSTIITFTAPSTGIYFWTNDNTGKYQTSLELSYLREQTGVIIQSPNKKWAITVDDSGNISATEITE